MASRRDLFQSYQFMVRRVIAGMVLRETDPVQDPLRRLVGAVFGGVMVTVLTLAVVGVIGVLRPGGNTSWQDGGRVVVEEETGARFVWLPDADGESRLHPVTDFASAALLAGSTTVVQVSADSLDDVPRGPRLGIPGAPDSLPPADRVLGSPWTLCSLPAETVSGETVPNTALVVGQGTSRGAAVGEDAVLVRDVEQGTLHVVLGGHQFPVPPSAEPAVLEGLALRTEPVLPVGTAWLSALPAGEQLAPQPVPGQGGASAVLPGAVVGQVRFVAAGDERQYYQVAVDRVVEITEVQARLLLADPTTRATAYGGQLPTELPLSPAEAAAAPRTELPEAQPTDPPATLFEVADADPADQTLCASFSAATAGEEDAVPQVTVQAAVDGVETAAVTQRRTQDGVVLADRVVVRPGWGTLVESVTAPGAAGGTLTLVTDEGIRYPLPSERVAAVLGYGGVEPVRLPASLVARVPAGPALDVADARLPG
ncbi:type VII secretion protein EccB [Modestobacter versicolor]|uniref:Type VII secretion protein EccB n=1 Tax=Modestobacter versicolor TaxID=429133 RepID=A0A323VFB8_9ACTN|nr:type VII secretion protein EccB [Modestobacter versicolor]MBB3677839.1 type VII secretion protein EccB [Modestobacter versicolor]PZA23345.1 type VII secretion protein EccB [Modestobacter versicolor]